MTTRDAYKWIIMYLYWRWAPDHVIFAGTPWDPAHADAN